MTNGTTHSSQVQWQVQRHFGLCQTSADNRYSILSSLKLTPKANHGMSGPYLEQMCLTLALRNPVVCLTTCS